MYQYLSRQSYQKPELQFLDSSNQCQQSPKKFDKLPSIFRIDRMKVKQQYDCFPQYIYNTAFGSLLTDLNCTNQLESIGDKKPKDDMEENFLSTNLCNNSAWNDDHNFQQPQSMEDIIKILIDFLGEFLLFLSSIINCEQFHSQIQLQKMINVAERIHQLRLTLLMQITNIDEHMLNSSTILDIPSISSILHELASFIYCLSNEQNKFGTIIEQPQLLNRLENILKSCIDYFNMHNNSQNMQTSMPMMPPCTNPPHIINNPMLPNECLYACNECNTCIPWSVLEQLKNSSESNRIFGLMYGIKDKNVRRKLGYGTGGRRSPKRSALRYKRNNYSIGEKISNQTPITFAKEKLQVNQKKKSKGLSISSLISHGKNLIRRIGSSLSISQPPSIANSKQSSPLFDSNSETNEPINLRSIRDRSFTSDSSRRMASPQMEDSPIGSMADRNDSQRTSRLNQQQSNIYEDNDDKNSLWAPRSFQTSEHRSPSKMSRENNQSLSLAIDTQQSRSIITTSTSARYLNSSPLPINETSSDFNFDIYSEHQISPSTSFLNQTSGNISPLKLIEGPDSAEGELEKLNTPDYNKKYMSPPQFSPISTHRQRSASDNSPLVPNIREQDLSQSLRRKKRKLNTIMPLQSTRQNYLNKFLNCFRRTIVNRVDRIN